MPCLPLTVCWREADLPLSLYLFPESGVISLRIFLYPFSGLHTASLYFSTFFIDEDLVHSFMNKYLLLLLSLFLIPLHTFAQDRPFITVLGIAQDAGFPQAGCEGDHCSLVYSGKTPQRSVVSLGLTDPGPHLSWIFEATPDFTRQHRILNKVSNGSIFSGIFLTHAHIGHYTGLMYTGREAMGTKETPVYALPEMRKFLSSNGPWSQLVTQRNILLKELQEDHPVQLSSELEVTAFRVPHRDEFSETAGFLIRSNQTSVLFIPDINKWHIWDTDIRELIQQVDHAFLDATFFDAAELPGRDMSEIPHPYVEESMKLFGNLPAEEKKKIIFIHFNHTNPLILDGPERKQVEEAGYRVAFEGMRITL